MERDIHDRLDRARSIARENLERAASGIRHGAEVLGERARSASTEAGKRMGDAGIQAGRAAAQANRVVTEHPMAAIAAAVAAGALVAHLFSRWRGSARGAVDGSAQSEKSEG